MTTRQKKKARKRAKKQLHRLLDIVLDTNGMESRTQEETGALPTVFLFYYGHINTVEVEIALRGWKPDGPTLTLLRRNLDRSSITDAEVAYVKRRCEQALMMPPLRF